MSELITRRTFLKTTGAAALAVPKIWLLLPSIIPILLILTLLPQISAP